MNGVFNPQQQYPVTWPHHPIIAMALVDQLRRSNAEASDIADQATEVLTKSLDSFLNGETNWRVARKIDQIAEKIAQLRAGESASRAMVAVAEQLR